MGTVLRATQSFHAPPANIDLIVGKRKVYYRSNMEFVTGILGTSNGGTGNSSFTDDTVIVYSGGKLISTDVTGKELSVLKGIVSDSSGGTTMTDLLNEKISGIKTYDGVLLDKDNVNHTVKLPDYLLKTGGQVSGNLQVVGKVTVGEHVDIKYDAMSKCVVFDIV